MKKIASQLIFIFIAIFGLAVLDRAHSCTLDLGDLFPFHRGDKDALRHLVVLGLSIVGVLLIIKHFGKQN